MVLWSDSSGHLPIALFVRNLCVIVVFSSVAMLQANDPQSWSRTISAEPANAAARAHEFTLYDIDQGELHLTGTCLYINGPLGAEPPKKLIIKGGRDRNGAFWPAVELQIKNEATGQWETIGSARFDKSSNLSIEPNDHRFDLMVNLDPFKPFIGKFTTGKIILATGEAAQFELKHLLPPQ